MRKRDDYRVAVKSVALLITIAACLLIVGLLFLTFCVVEALVLLFTGGAFSLVFPAIATAVAVFVIMALHGSVCSFVFVVSVRRYQHRGHHGQRTERGGYHITHYISVIVLTCPDVTAL